MALSTNSSNRFGPSSYIVGTPANGLGNGVNFTSIQAAVNQAVADGFGVANPVDVVIRAGVYTEDVTITDGGISLVGVSDAPNNLLGQQTFINGTISLVITGINQFALSNMFVRGVLGPALSVTGGVTPCRMSADNCTFGSLAAATPGVTFTNASGTFGLAVFTSCSLTSALAEAHFSSARTVSVFFSCNVRGSTNMVTLDGSARVQLLYSVGNASAGFGVQFLNAANQVAACRFSSIDATDSIVDMTVGGSSTLEHCTFSSGAASGFFITGTGNLVYTDLVNTGSAIDLDPAIGVITVGDWKPYAHPGVGPAPSLGTVRGTSCFDNTQFTVTEGFVELVGGVAASTFPVDNGGPGVPLAGAMSFLGSTSVDFPNPSGIETHVGATTNQIYFEDRRWVSPLIVDPDATVGLRGTFTTITAALAAALPQQTVYVRPGVYAESFTLVDQVQLIGLTTPGGNKFGLGSVGVIVTGTVTSPPAGATCEIQNMRIVGAGPAIMANGLGSVVRIYGCTLASAVTAIDLSNGQVFLESCYVTGGTSAIDYNTNGGTYFEANNCTIDANANVVDLATDSQFVCNNTILSSFGAGGIFATSACSVNVTNSKITTLGSPCIDMQVDGTADISFSTLSSPIQTINFNAVAPLVSSFHNTHICTGAASEYVVGPGKYEYADDVIRPITFAGIDLAASQTIYGWRPWASVVTAPGTSSTKGVASFDDVQFTATDGFIQLSGGNSPPFTDVSGVVSALRNNGYYATAATTFTLDSLALQGDLVIIYADTAAAVVLTANAGQSIRMGTAITAVAGTATSTAIGDSITLRYRASTLFWEVVSSIGNWILV